MKKVLLILVAIGLVFTSCKKEEPLTENNQTVNTGSNNTASTYDKELYVNVSYNVLEHMDSIVYTVETGVYQTIYPDTTDFDFYDDNGNGLQDDDWYLTKIGTNCDFNQISCTVYANVPSLGGSYPYLGYYCSMDLIYDNDPTYYGPFSVSSTNWTDEFNGAFTVNF